jgi:hypothetical protein
MGNIDSRAAFQGGYIYVKTHQPYYYPGNKVLGKIYIRCNVPMSAKELRIRVKGKEKASFFYEETETYHENGETKTRTHRRKTKVFKKLLEFDGVCWTFNP